MAQTPQYYNYNTNGSNNSFPFNQPSGKEVQLLYTPGVFNQPTPAPAGNLTSIYFRIADTYPLGPWTYTDFTIKLGQSSIFSFDPGVLYTGAMTTVYYRASVSLTGTAGQWMSIAFDTPFPYDPSQSLIVDISQCGAPGATGYSMCFTTLSDNLRNYSNTGCPFTYYGQNPATYHIGFDICTTPSAPANTTPPQNQSVCSGYNTTLSASGVGTLGWYDAPTGGTWLGGGTSYVTNNLVTPTTFYVQDSACTASFTRTPILVNINSSYAFNEIQSICDGDSLWWQGSYHKTTGSYSANFLTVNNCDSIYSLILYVNPTYTFNESHNMCYGDTYNWQGTDYTTANTYTASYSTINGCDSIYTLNLIVNPVYAFTENYTICDGNTYHWQGSDYTTTNTYTANYTSISGCDSIYTLNLTVNPSYAFTQNHSMCNGETYNWQGTDYSIGNTYTANYTSINGCDSVYTLSLFVNTVDTSLTVADPVITANASGATFQWLDCDNAFAPIPGETSQVFNAVANGNYAVEVTQGSCTDTSYCVQIITIGIESVQTNGISIYPNPVSDELIIESKGNQKEFYFEIFNSIGQVVFKGNLVEKAIVKTSNFDPGVYYFRAKFNDSTVISKVIKL